MRICPVMSCWVWENWEGREDLGAEGTGGKS